ncbi:hypothetical protein PNK_1855 [Candidatus Protochlamydia naegleriophila]|uniref:Uncharacterized protein n=1 Tax=Candidatus Protochlamydia naegleriophila TaxID=389348 RepID=A0A0U5JHK1_9BACT|nr:hypothetical protein PNK_1855 [Candidatus Protochlamydia naegleriophila]
MNELRFMYLNFQCFSDVKTKGLIPKNEAFCLLEVERIELSSLANYELTTTCLSFFQIPNLNVERANKISLLHLVSKSLP